MPPRTGFPAQLIALCTSVAFERTAYFGLQSILALYLADLLVDQRAAEGVWLLPQLSALTGSSGVALAAVVTGLFGAIATVAPLLGGLIADRLIGQHRAIVLGGVMMAAGHALLIAAPAIIPALLAIALGSGFFKGSVAARLSGLYMADDPRRVEGFRLFYIAINIAGLVAPLMIGTLGEEVHWHAGFALSCAAMVAGLALYVARVGGVSGGGLEHDEVPAPAAAAPRRSEWPVLAALGAATALLAVPNAQLTNAYLLWASEGFVRDLAGWQFPASWIIAADGLVSLAALAVSGVFWAWHEARRGLAQPDTKALIGAQLVIAATACLVMAALVHGRTGVPLVWGIAFQLLNSLGLANVFPAVMARFGQAAAAPGRAPGGATMMAGFYLALFCGGMLSTALASQFTSLPIATFWLLHAASAVAGTAVLLALRTAQRRAASPPPLAT
jgi:POT family proton-dependent oligopeptide transporter